MKDEIVILSAARTAIGKYGGALKAVKATELGSAVIVDAMKKANLAPTDIEECIMGNVIATGMGQNPARQSAIGAGLPVEIGSYTVNDVCGSGLKSVMNAADAIKAKEYKVIVAGGIESMSNIPYYLDGARWGFNMGDRTLIDTMIHDGLWDVFNNQHMGMTGEIVAERFKVTREDADKFSVDSHKKAAAAQAAGKFKKEITPFVIKGKKGDTVFEVDEGVRGDTTLESLAGLRPAFKKDGGVVTAGNASQLSDGAAAVIVTSRAWAEERGIKPLASIVAYGERGVKPELIMEAPIPTTEHVLKKAGMKAEEIDLFEHNEAFATASCAVKKAFNVPDDKFNVNGGAVALGHPIGCSGTRVLVTLVNAMHDRNKQTGLCTLCLGGGNAVTMVVRKE